MSSISFNFDNVYLLFLAIPLVLLFTVPFIVIFTVKKDNRNGHTIASIAIHVVMAILIAFSAAGTSITTTITETNVYVVADVSYSANKNLDTVDSYIKNIKLPPNSRKGVICFGKDYKLITRLGERFDTVKSSGIDDSETNIVSALNYAGTLFREDVIKRIVLITDGKQTYESDSNALKRAVDGLTQKGIKVDAMFLDDNVRSDVKEVQISDAEFSSKVYLNNKESVSAVIQSSYDTDAVCTLFKGDEQLSARAENLTAGSNYVTFNNLDTSVAGTFDYRIEVTVRDDTNLANNVFYFTQTVADSMDILLITGEDGDRVAFEGLYGDRAVIHSYVNTSEIPCSVEALCKYDEIIISNYNVSKANNSGLFMQSVDTAVSLFGKTLLTFGDTGIQNDDEGNMKVLSDMLPVIYGNGNLDSKLYTIVLDGSRSMFQIDKFKRAKIAACRLVDLLNDGDSISVVVFHGDFEVIQTPTDAANREEVKRKINDLGVTQGTFISLGLNEAFKLIKGLPFGEKQVMLISDGLTYTGETDDPIEIVRNMTSNEIVTSVIDVGRGAANDTTANEAKRLLENIAQVGLGNYYYANDDKSLEDVLFGEIGENINESIVESNSYVTVNLHRDEVVDGISDKFTPVYVGGFMNSKRRESANTVLTVDYQKPNGGTVAVPLYAYWSYGNGQVASFTSKISGSWIDMWKKHDGLYSSFFNNVLDTTKPQEKIDYPFTADITRENGRAVVNLTPATIRADASVAVNVTLPDGQTLEGNMSFASTGFNYGFAAYDVGKYTVDITYSYAEKDYTASFAFTVPYLSEYDSFIVFEASGLYKMLAGTGGTVSENGQLSIVNDESEIGKYIIYLTVPLLIACVALFAVDIMVRKLKWEDIKSLFIKVNK